MKFFLYNSIINNYEKYYKKLHFIFLNIPYNKKLIKLKKHFPLIHFNSFDDFLTFSTKHKNISFSLLVGDIEQQKKVILETIERRCNTIKVFSNNLKYSINNNYILKQKYDIDIMDIDSFKDDILYFNTPNDIIQHFPDFERKDGSCMFEYIYSIKTENIHHYIDLKNMKLCDRILVCINKNTLNIMFQSSNLNIPNDKLLYNIKTLFDNKIMSIDS